MDLWVTTAVRSRIFSIACDQPVRAPYRAFSESSVAAIMPCHADYITPASGFYAAKDNYRPLVFKGCIRIIGFIGFPSSGLL